MSRRSRISRSSQTERRDMICGCALIAVSVLGLAGFTFAQTAPHVPTATAVVAAALAGGMLLLGAVSAVLASLD
ncbi:hypothetical protein [Bradyrhizobium sp. 174]|uniref:hypothetical protein n=1 Tax=Bradyrhizobium sp. 174 TaxID=2782645 RepID=UPI001FF860BC|nr:hypothetical protein [Bradyrhizobium sp. 174]